MKDIFVYCLLDPNSGECRYVGVSNNPNRRFKAHILHEQNSPHKWRWIKNLLNNNQIPILKILEKCNQNNWQNRERWWISFFKKKEQSLTNLTLGGEGTFGLPCSQQKKQKISQSLMGHEVSEEAKLKMSKIVEKRIKENGHPMLGRKHSEEARKKMSLSHLGYEMPKTQREKMSKTRSDGRMRRRLDVTYGVILQLAKEGLGRNAIATKLSCDRECVSYWIKKKGFLNWNDFIQNKDRIKG